MQDHARSFPRLVSVLVLTLTLLCSAYGQSTSLKGSFGSLSNAQLRPLSTDGGVASLGMINFDGVGNLTGTYNILISATAKEAAQQISGTLAGTYSSNPDGTFSATLNLDAGFSETLSGVVTDGGQGLQLTVTQCDCNLGGIVISGVARAAYTGPLKGSYGFQLNNSPTPSSTFGVMKFDGAGNATVSFTSVGIASDVNGNDPGKPPAMKGTLNGTYSVNPDGSGTIDLTASSGGTFGFVVTDGGSGLLLLLTSATSLNNVSFGTARLQ